MAETSKIVRREAGTRLYFDGKEWTEDGKRAKGYADRAKAIEAREKLLADFDPDAVPVVVTKDWGG